MKKVTRAFLIISAISALLTYFPHFSYSQEAPPDVARVHADSVIITRSIDSTLMPGARSIDMDIDQAVKFLNRWYRSGNLWNSKTDPLRSAMGRLLFEATNDPLYRTEEFVRDYNWDNIRIPSDNFFTFDTVHILVTYPSRKVVADSVPEEIPSSVKSDSLLATSIIPVDSLHAVQETGLTELSGGISLAPQGMLIDSIILVVKDTLSEVISTNSSFPFRYYNYPMTGDSIMAAIGVLIEETLMHDSTRVVVKGSDSNISLWLGDRSNRLEKLWLKNEWNEDVSIWVGTSNKDTIDLIVERGVHFRRFNKETNFANAQIDVKQLDNKTLVQARKLELVPQYWKFLSEAAFTFNQAMIKNWSKGGESNIAFTLDLQGTADFTNKVKKISWSTTGRFKFGYMASGEHGTPSSIDVRKNIDQIDISSKFNNKAFGKFDFSSTLIFKTQLAPGYAYPNDSVMISKFFNPASLTLGVGLEYKPNKNTSINFAPFSYKGTYVPDTAHIDQTKLGLLADQRARHEPGMSAQIDHKITLFKDITIINRVRLFTNYIHNPLNVDIDWELIATAKLNWFTDIRLNTHFIYDDDTLIPVYKDDGTALLGSDGIQKKWPMVQFKEIIGLSVIFRF